MDYVDFNAGTVAGGWWSTWLSSLFVWPKTESELRSEQQADLAKIAAVNPELAAAGLAAGDAAASAYADMHRSEYANYKAVSEFQWADGLLMLAGGVLLAVLVAGRR